MKTEKRTIAYRIARVVFYPLMVSLTLLFSVLLVSYLPEKQFVFIPGMLLLFFIPIFLLGEWLMPYRREWQASKGDLRTDFIQTFLVLPAASKISELLIPMIFYFPVLWLNENAGFRVMFSDAGLWAGFFIALACCELLYYWFHRFCHKRAVLWRFHAVHHGAERVYWINSGRFHFLEAIVSSMVYFLPLIFLNVSPEVIILVIAFSSITGFMEHVNIDFRAGYFNYVFNSAELHRWHHSRIIDESNRNFGKALVIWDLLFGTFYLPKGKEVGQVGIDDADVPNSFVGQLLYPFRKR